MSQRVYIAWWKLTPETKAWLFEKVGWKNPPSCQPSDFPIQLFEDSGTYRELLERVEADKKNKK